MSGAAVAPAQATTSKREATIIAALALKGHAVHRLATGGFLVSRWTGTRHCQDVESLDAFARQVGALR